MEIIGILYVVFYGHLVFLWPLAIFRDILLYLFPPFWYAVPRKN
jgi:hypothetical protein